jgi:hypothetical protein
VALRYVSHLGAGDEIFHLRWPAVPKLSNKSEIFLPSCHQLANAGGVYLKAVGAQVPDPVRQTYEPLLPPRRQYDRCEADRIRVVAVRLMEAAGEADLLDDGAIISECLSLLTG